MHDRMVGASSSSSNTRAQSAGTEKVEESFMACHPSGCAP
jgi:hypothetical protein